ncbi:hypothetical protein BC567DRAFT_218926 [Phyllosticta citribraziliensis]
MATLLCIRQPAAVYPPPPTLSANLCATHQLFLTSGDSRSSAHARNVLNTLAQSTLKPLPLIAFLCKRRRDPGRTLWLHAPRLLPTSILFNSPGACLAPHFQASFARTRVGNAPYRPSLQGPARTVRLAAPERVKPTHVYSYSWLCSVFLPSRRPSHMHLCPGNAKS